MIIEPRIRGFICTAAHPAGCEQAVLQEVEYAKTHVIRGENRPRNVLVIGASTGYGLASRIVAAFGYGANTLGVFFDRPADERRTATAGWYNTAAFEKLAAREGLYAASINGDAFSDEIRRQVAARLREKMQQVDLVIYSLASPVRVHPDTGEQHRSVLKPMGHACTSRTVDAFRGEVRDITLEPATEKEIADTVAVMGGDDWERWMDFLAGENLLAEGAATVAYSYIGPSLTHAIYRDGTIGAAKKDLAAAAQRINSKLAVRGGRAVISVNKAVVTQASAAIPVVPLYISLLFKYMKEKGTHENCIQQIVRLFNESLYATGQGQAQIDSDGMIRLDDLEMDAEIQQQVAEAFPQITTENVAQLTDIAGYREDFYRLFGFGLAGVNYAADVLPSVEIASLSPVA